MAQGQKTIKLEQVGSPQRRHFDQRQTLIGLGLNKIGRTRDLPDTPATNFVPRSANDNDQPETDR